MSEWPGGIFNFKVLPYDAPTGTPAGGFVASIQSVATMYAGHPSFGVEKTCWPAHASYPYDTYVSFGSTYKKDKDLDWTNVVASGTSHCADSNYTATYRSFQECLQPDQPNPPDAPDCWSTMDTPTLPDNAAVTLAHLVPHAGVYKVHAQPTQGAEIVAQVVIRAATGGAGTRRVEEWCLPPGFFWPGASGSWTKYEFVDRNPANGDACPTGNTIVKYNTDTF